MLRKLIGSVALLAAMLTLLPVATASAEPAVGRDAPPLARDGHVVRLAGENRFATSAATARALWPDGAATVVLATGLDYPDALAGGALAATHGAPLVLAATHELPAEARAALVELQPSEVILLGGPAALSPNLERQVRDLPGAPRVARIAGTTRFETAAQIAAVAGRDGSGDVVVATGFDFPDAVAAGALTAGTAPMPVLLSTRDALVTGLGAGERAFLMGGAAALGAGVEHEARAQAREVARLAGPDRFATSQAAADHALRHRLSGQVPLVVATGQQFPDALSAGAAAARSGGPLLLIPTQGPTPAQASWIGANRDRFTGVVVVGGTSAVSDVAAHRLGELLRPAPAEPVPPPAPDPGPATCVDVNTETDLDELQRIVHIGPVRVHDLIANRPYATLDDLLRINGIGPDRLQDIKDQGLASVRC